MSGLTVAFAGLTHLGIVSAAAAAEHCDRVIGYDADAGRVAGLAAGRLPIEEPGLADLVAKGGNRLTWTSDVGALRRPTWSTSRSTCRPTRRACPTSDPSRRSWKG